MNAPFDTSTPLTETELDRREAMCRALAASAGELAMEGFRKAASGRGFSMKGPQDYLTESDALVEEHIRSRLGEEFPGDGFLGEEGGGAVAPRLWVVDPIDGTANFARGIPHFAISIAFVDQGRVEIGAIASPAMGETYFARRGRGATRNDQPIHAASTRDLDSASVEFGWSPRIGNDDYVRAFGAILATGANIRRSASGTLGLAYVADGRSDAYAELHINSWDCLAGLLIAREAGARINAFLLGGGLSNGNPVLAAAPGIAVAIANATGIALPGEGDALSLRPQP